MKSKELFVVAAVVVGSALRPAFGQQAPPASPPMPYETYCKMDRMGKQEARRAMTPEQRVDIARTQLERWRDANQSRLSADQLSLIKEWLAVIPETVASGPRSPEMKAKLSSLEARLGAAFSREDQRAMDEYGPCIGKK